MRREALGRKFLPEIRRGGKLVVRKLGISGHFFLDCGIWGGGGNMTLVLGFNHLLTILQSPGIPAHTLPSSKKKTKYLYYGIASDVYLFFIPEMQLYGVRTI